MSTIKICGYTEIADIERSGELVDGRTSTPLIDIVGLNFVSTSPRCVDTKKASILAARAQTLGMQVAAIVMDPSSDFLKTLIQEVPLDFIQLHGTEPTPLLAHVGDLPIIKALSWTGRDEELQLAQEWSQVGAQLHAFLVDAYAPDEGGGTGRVADWDALSPRPEPLQSKPVWLAGGLRPENVARAITTTHCVGVDTASGVESSPGHKDIRLIHDFANRSREAFAACGL